MLIVRLRNNALGGLNLHPIRAIIQILFFLITKHTLNLQNPDEVKQSYLRLLILQVVPTKK